MAEIDNLYQELILAHSSHPYGKEPNFENSNSGSNSQYSGFSKQYNPTCGDTISLQTVLDSAADKIDKIVWDGQGCAISQASASIMTEMLEGKETAFASKYFAAMREMLSGQGKKVNPQTLDFLDEASIFEGVNKFPMRIKCALLGIVALEDAIRKAENE